MEPRRSVLAPNVERWLAQAGGRELESSAAGPGDSGDSGGGERRTLVVRFPSSADPGQAADRLRDAGATVQTAGQASATVAVTRETLQRLLVDEPWIVAVEEPRRLFPTTGPDLPDL